MNKPHTADFFRLPKDTRERFVGCCTGQAPPAPLLQIVPKLGNTIFWRVLLCAAVAGGVAWLGYNGFGEIGDSWMVQGFFPLLLYIGLLFLGALGILGAVRAVVLRRQLPFPPGKYLFPFDLVDAGTKDLRILPLAALESTRMVEHQNEGTYTHTAFEFQYEGGEKHSFNVGNRVTAEMVAQSINASREAIRAAIDAQDLQKLAALDVFVEARLTGTWQQEPEAGAAGPKLTAFFAHWLAQWRWAALAAAVVVAIPLWHLRNIRSDDIGFRNAIAWAAEGGPGFEEYLRLGRRHVDKVRTTFLPRAAIRKARESGALSDLERLAEKHRGTPLEKEATEARESVLADMASRADRANDIRALRDFLKANPGSRLAPHVHGAIARIYGLAKLRYGVIGAKDPAAAAFMERLLDHLGAADSPEVLVRFERKPAGAVLGLDDAAWGDVEDTFVRQLNIELATLWAKDADQFVAFRREAGAAQSSPQPVMSIAYEVTPRGRNVAYSFAVRWELPDAAAPKLTLQLARPPRGVDGPRQAFHDLELRLRLQLFRDRPLGLLGPTAIGPDPTLRNLPTRGYVPPTRIPWGDLPGWPPR